VFAQAFDIQIDGSENYYHPKPNCKEVSVMLVGLFPVRILQGLVEMQYQRTGIELQPFNSSTLQLLNPSTLCLCEGGTTEAASDSAREARPKQPQTLRAQRSSLNPSTLQPFNSSTSQLFNPSTLQPPIFNEN